MEVLFWLKEVNALVAEIKPSAIEVATMNVHAVTTLVGLGKKVFLT